MGRYVTSVATPLSAAEAFEAGAFRDVASHTPMTLTKRHSQASMSPRRCPRF